MATKKRRIANNGAAKLQAVVNALKQKTTFERLLDDCFPEQRAFIEDTARMKAGLCTRRAGKSFAAGVALVRECLATPGVSCMYGALSRESAQKILFKDVLFVLNRTYNLGMVFNRTTLTVSFPNGSMLYLIGLDSGPEEASKILGQKFKLVVVDECGKFTQDLEEMVHRVIKPALIDLRGTIALIGTPEDNQMSFFHKVTKDIDPEVGWSVHRWSANDNPHVKEQNDEEIARILELDPEAVKLPRFQQHYLGKWAISSDAQVYLFSKKKNVIYDRIPDDLIYILAVDLGFDDDTAFSVVGYSLTNPTVYVVESYKVPKLIITDVAKHLLGLKERYNPQQMICDSISKQATQELQQRYALPLQFPQKYKKIEYIQLMNSDFMTGRVQVWHACRDLMQEYATLIWDPKAAPGTALLQGMPDHCADATLYGWRLARTYVIPETPDKIEPHSEAAMDQWWEQQAKPKENGESFLERDWNNEFSAWSD